MSNIAIRGNNGGLDRGGPMGLAAMIGNGLFTEDKETAWRGEMGVIIYETKNPNQLCWLITHEG